MRKIITFTIIGLLSLASCTKYDEIAMWNRSAESDVEKAPDTPSYDMSLPLEWCARMNTNAASLRVMVEASTRGDYVTGTVPVVKNGETTGYAITFAESRPAMIYHGADGLHATTPVIGVRQDSDGVYYWTLDGQWLTDSDKRIAVRSEPADATPRLDIDDGYWYISCDGKETWHRLRPVAESPEEAEKAKESAYCDIDVSEPDRLVLTLTRDGERVELPCYDNSFDLVFVSGEEVVRELSFYCGPGTTTEVSYRLTDPMNAVTAVECIAGGGYKATVDRAGCKISISAPDTPAAVSDPECVILVLVSDDVRTIIRRLVVRQVRYIEYTATRQIAWSTRYGTPRFSGEYEYFDEFSSYDPATGKGRWGYAGTMTAVVPNAFIGDTEIRSIAIPEGVVTIGDNAFNNSAIEAVTLPESLVSIGDAAFLQTNMAEITIPANVERLGISAFAGSGAGTSPLKRAIFAGDRVETIEGNTFADCRALREVRLPEGLKKIGYNAFIRCYALESIDIPDAVTVIEKQVFSHCSGLKSVTLGTQLESIGANAFNRCFALESVLCPAETPATLGSGVFPVTDGFGSYTANYRIYVPDAQLETYRERWPDYWAAPNNFQITKVIYGISSMPAKSV